MSTYLTTGFQGTYSTRAYGDMFYFVQYIKIMAYVYEGFLLGIFWDLIFQLIKIL